MKISLPTRLVAIVSIIEYGTLMLSIEATDSEMNISNHHTLRRNGNNENKALFDRDSKLMLDNVDHAERHLATCPSTYSACQNRPLLSQSSSYNAAVVDLQCILNSKNSAGLVVDGYFGPLTNAAVKAWQSKMALVVDGIVGTQTWNTLCGAIYEISPPASFCSSSVSYWPSSTYTDQIKKTAFNSDGATYQDLAKTNAATYSVHPGLLTAHMVRESSMGRNNRCVASSNKSILTGCGWPPSCATNCGCTGSAVMSDKGQVSCTANTDKNAYNQAKTGAGSGAYVKCSNYNYSEDLIWKCILCVYQGNYYSDITGNKGKYFVRDKTCAYAEEFKTEFCRWKAYFAVN